MAIPVVSKSGNKNGRADVVNKSGWAISVSFSWRYVANCPAFVTRYSAKSTASVQLFTRSQLALPPASRFSLCWSARENRPYRLPRHPASQ